MKKTALLLCLLLASLHARADLVIVQNVDTGGSNHNITIKIKDDHFRTDISEQFSSITDLSSGDIITLIHSKKAFIKMTGAQMHDNIEKRMQAALQGQTPPTAADVPKVVDTGKTEKIGNYTAEIYTSQTKLRKFTYWVSKDYADYKAVNAEMHKFKDRQNSLSDKMATRNYLVPDTTKLDGVVLKTETVDNAGVVSTMTLVSAEIKPLDDTIFQPPADYTEIQPPGAQAPPSATPAAPSAPAAAPRIRTIVFVKNPCPSADKLPPPFKPFPESSP